MKQWENQNSKCVGLADRQRADTQYEALKNSGGAADSGDNSLQACHNKYYDTVYTVIKKPLWQLHLASYH